MANKLFTILKGLLLTEDGTLNPKKITITPGGTANTTTSIVSSQTTDKTLTLPDHTGTVLTDGSTAVVTNKSINADNNTITNLENDNIKVGAGIDVTKLADGSVTNVELQYINTVSSNVQTQIDNANSASATVQSNLNDHINDTTDAHDASAISNIPSGNLAATNVQDALNELQSNVDTAQSDLSAHIADAIDAHDASAVSVVPTGNLSSNQVQAALEELQTAIDNIIAGTNPSGVVFAFAGTSVPAGYLLCDGSLVSRTTYATLFATIGTAHGQGDGSTTFNLPDYRGQFLRGVAGASANDPDKTSRTAMASGGNTGNNVGTVQTQATRKNGLILNSDHVHETPLGDGNIANQPWGNGVTRTLAFGAGVASIPTGITSPPYTGVPAPGFGPYNTMSLTNGDNETRPINAYVNYIIKV